MFLTILLSYTGILLDKTPMLMGMRKDIYNNYSYALEFSWVRLPPLIMGMRNDDCNI